MFIIDVQGFSYGNGNNFICKEIAILNVMTGATIHKMLEMPHHFNMFSKEVKNHMGWLLRNLHGLQWSSSQSDYLKYEKLSEFIKDEVKNEIVMVKGLLKKEWLNKTINNVIVNLEDEGCPNLTKLKSVFKSNHCNQHLYNNLNCALENVTFLWYWYTVLKK